MRLTGYEGLERGLDVIENTLNRVDPGLTCELDHSLDPRKGPFKAVGILQIPKKTGGIITFPYCDVCEVSLKLGDKSDWQLFVCFNCLSTGWISRETMNKMGYYYEKQIIVIDGMKCPHCE